MTLGRIYSCAIGGLVTFLLVACGSDDDGGGSSGVVGSKKLSALSSSEVASVCDWAAAKYGGYGKQIMCGKDTNEVWANQAQCVTSFMSSFADCANGTVSQAEACVGKQAAAPCDDTVRDGAECAALDTACGG